MTQITVLPHDEYCPDGAIIEAETGQTLCNALLAGGVEIDHACAQSCACTTCHVIVREGFDSLEEATDNEEDMLDRAWGLTPRSRLSCQVIIGSVPLTVEIPRYTINLAREEKHG
jgi:2Fe-2S ferredoxin